MHKENQKLLSILQECASECNHCYHACMQEDDVKHMTRCIQMNRNCADVCSLLAGLIASGSEFTKELIDACARICEACAEECGRHQEEHCQACARVCRECAEACHQPV